VVALELIASIVVSVCRVSALTRISSLLDVAIRYRPDRVVSLQPSALREFLAGDAE